MRVLHSHLDKHATGFVELDSWVLFVGKADGDSILMSRGVTTKQSLGDQGDSAIQLHCLPGPQGGGGIDRVLQSTSSENISSENTSWPIDELAATVTFNAMSPEEDYKVFDRDTDGKVSYRAFSTKRAII